MASMLTSNDIPMLCDHVVQCGLNMSNIQLYNASTSTNQNIYNIQLLYGNESIPDTYHKIEYTLGGSLLNLNNSGIVDVFHSTVSLYISYRQVSDEPAICDIQLINDKSMIPYDYILLNNDINKNTLYKSCYITYKRCRQPSDIPLCNIGFLNTKYNEVMDCTSEYTQWYTNIQNINNTYQLCMQRHTTNLLQYKFKSHTQSMLHRSVQTNNTELINTMDSLHHYCYTSGIQLYRTQPTPFYNTFMVTTQSGHLLYVSTLTVYTTLDTALLQLLDIYQSIDQSVLYQPITLCTVSQYPYYQSMTQYLKHVYALIQQSQQQQLTQSLDSVFSVLFNTPLSRSPNTITQIQCTTPYIDIPALHTGLDFTMCNFNLSVLFHTLSIQTIIKVYASILTERKIVLYSNNASLLTPISETLRYLLYPFQWQYTYVPVCPNILYGVLDAPMPILVGIVCNTVDIQSMRALNDDLCIVNIDTDQCTIYGNELITLPDSLQQQLIHELSQYCSFIRHSTIQHHTAIRRSLPSSSRFNTPSKPPSSPVLLESPHSQITRQSNTVLFNTVGVRASWLHLLVALLNGIDEYLLFPVHENTSNILSDTLFATEKFISTKPNTYKLFLTQLCSTQLFSTFIEQKTYGTQHNTASFDLFDRSCQYEVQYRTVKGTIAKYGAATGLTQIAALCDKLVQRQPTSVVAVYHVQQHTTDTTQLYTYDFTTPLNQSLVHVHECNIQQLHPASNTVLDHTQLTQLFDAAYNPHNTVSPVTPNNKQITSIEPMKYALNILRTIYIIWYEYVSLTIQTQCNVDQSIRVMISQLDRMLSLSIPADENIYKSILVVCGQYNMKQEAGMIVNQMKRNGIKLNSMIYSAYNNAVQHTQPSNPQPGRHNESVVQWSTVYAGVGCVCTSCNDTMCEAEILQQYMHTTNRYNTLISCCYCNGIHQQPILMLSYSTVLGSAHTIQYNYLSPWKLRKQLNYCSTQHSIDLNTLYHQQPELHWNLLWQIKNTQNDAMLNVFNVNMVQCSAYDVQQQYHIHDMVSTVSPSSTTSDDFIHISNTNQLLDYNTIDVHDIQNQLLQRFGTNHIAELNDSQQQLQYQHVLNQLNHKITDSAVQCDIQQYLHQSDYQSAVELYLRVRIQTNAELQFNSPPMNNDHYNPVKSTSTILIHRTTTFNRVGLRHLPDYFVSLMPEHIRYDQLAYTTYITQLHSVLHQLPVQLKNELIPSELYYNKYIHTLHCVLQQRGSCHTTVPYKPPPNGGRLHSIKLQQPLHSLPQTPPNKANGTCSQFSSPSVLTHNSLPAHAVSYNINSTPNKQAKTSNNSHQVDTRRMSTTSVPQHKTTTTNKTRLSSLFDRFVDIVTEVPVQSVPPLSTKPTIGQNQSRRSVQNVRNTNVTQ